MSAAPPLLQLVNNSATINLSHMMRTPPSALAMSQAQPVYLDSAPGLLALKHVEPARRLALEAHSIF
jgi:hypothetical protein